MNHLVCHGVFQAALGADLVCTDLNSIFRIEASSLPLNAATAVDVIIGDFASQLANILAQITYHGAYTPGGDLSKKTNSISTLVL